MSRGKIFLISAIILILLISFNNILANDYYYLTDNNIQEVNLNDTLVLIRADTIGGVSSSRVPHSYAVGSMITSAILTFIILREIATVVRP